MIPRFRIDDVFQTVKFSSAQLVAIEVMPFNDWFWDAARLFEDGYVKLAIVAEGIKSNPRLVEYINKHPKWEVQCHGWEHTIMSSLPEETVYQELKKAKELIEKTFEQKVTQFYPPKHYISENIYRACVRLRLSVMLDRDIPDTYLENPCMREVYFHPWNPKQVDQVRKILGK